VALCWLARAALDSFPFFGSSAEKKASGCRLFATAALLRGNG